MARTSAGERSISMEVSMMVILGKKCAGWFDGIGGGDGDGGGCEV
jgi:hypothetical protein